MDAGCPRFRFLVSSLFSISLCFDDTCSLFRDTEFVMLPVGPCFSSQCMNMYMFLICMCIFVCFCFSSLVFVPAYLCLFCHMIGRFSHNRSLLSDDRSLTRMFVLQSILVPECSS